jgi:uncharacterized protein (DUF1778 family)
MADTKKTTLQVRLDPANKNTIIEAAKLRNVGISDYIRLVLVPAAKREVELAKIQVIQMTADEQERFWQALQFTANPTDKQIELGKIMQGGL